MRPEVGCAIARAKGIISELEASVVAFQEIANCALADRDYAAATGAQTKAEAARELLRKTREAAKAVVETDPLKRYRKAYEDASASGSSIAAMQALSKIDKIESQRAAEAAENERRRLAGRDNAAIVERVAAVINKLPRADREAMARMLQDGLK